MYVPFGIWDIFLSLGTQLGPFKHFGEYMKIIAPKTLCSISFPGSGQCPRPADYHIRSIYLGRLDRSQVVARWEEAGICGGHIIGRYSNCSSNTKKL